MADASPVRRVLPARQRRESAAKRRANASPEPSTPAPTKPTLDTPSASESKSKKRPAKRAKPSHVDTPTRSASTPISTTDDVLPTKLTASRPLPSLMHKQAEDLSTKQYQSIADSAILAASLHRSRMQWLCDGVFTKYWTKPTRRKKAPVEEPPNNPEVKSMQKLGPATITIEPHTFEAMFYVVREISAPPPSTPLSKGLMPAPPPFKPLGVNSPTPSVSSPLHADPRPPSMGHNPTTAKYIPKPTTKQVNTFATSSRPPATVSRPATPPGGAKTTDPVIQMLASRAATDNNLKGLMQVVATSRATPDQLREFQAHIDEFNALVKKQQAEKDTKAKLAVSTSAPALTLTPTSTPTPTIPHVTSPATGHPVLHNSVHRNSPLNPAAAPVSQFTPFPAQPRPEARVKHVVIEFTSPLSATQNANPDRWLFPEHAVLDTQYGGTEMTCSFLVQRKGSDMLALLKDLSPEELHVASSKWKATVEYYQPVTIIVKAAQNRTIATIAHSAKSLPDVQKYMREIIRNHTRAPQEYLIHRLPREKADSTVEFVDSAVELSAEDDDLVDFYPL